MWPVGFLRNVTPSEPKNSTRRRRGGKGGGGRGGERQGKAKIQ